ncbi:hypothetical protein BH09ACT1_BH09ACT1_12100 [soil metagenome]
MSDIASPPVATASPAEQLPQPKAGNGFGLAALILGIVTMAGFAIPFVNFVSIGTGVIGLALGIIGMIIKFRPRKAALAGVILSGLGLILSIILVVVYTAAFAGAVKAVSDSGTVPLAGGSTSSSDKPSATSSFKDGVLTTPDMKIEITDHKIIPVGQPGNEYGDKPVLAIYYNTTNLSDKATDPTTAFLFAMSVYQDNDPNSVNKLDLALLPDAQFSDTQLEDIKNGGTVPNAVGYELDDLTTPVDLVASENLGLTKLGKTTIKLQ